MKLSHLLQSKGSAVVTVRPEEQVRALVALLTEHRVGAVVVSPDGVEVAGIVSERDVINALARTGVEVMTEPVSAICTLAVHTAVPDTPVEQVMQTMTEARVRHIPVLDADGGLAGIVSIGDIVKNRIDALAFERDALQSYVTSGG